jgi:hypothetical protein
MKHPARRNIGSSLCLCADFLDPDYIKIGTGVRGTASAKTMHRKCRALLRHRIAQERCERSAARAAAFVQPSSNAASTARGAIGAAIDVAGGKRSCRCGCGAAREGLGLRQLARSGMLPNRGEALRSLWADLVKAGCKLMHARHGLSDPRVHEQQDLLEGRARRRKRLERHDDRLAMLVRHDALR